MKGVPDGLCAPPRPQLMDRISARPVASRSTLAIDNRLEISPPGSAWSREPCVPKWCLGHDEAPAPSAARHSRDVNARVPGLSACPWSEITGFLPTMYWKKPQPRAALQVSLSMRPTRAGGPTGSTRQVRCSSSANRRRAASRSRRGVRNEWGPSGSLSDQRSARSSQNSQFPFGVTANQIPPGASTLALSCRVASRSTTCSRTLTRNMPSNWLSRNGRFSPAATRQCVWDCFGRWPSISSLRSQPTLSGLRRRSRRSLDPQPTSSTRLHGPRNRLTSWT